MTAPFLTSPLLTGVSGIRHGFFTRRGGVSTGLYESLNVGRGSRDLAARVSENRRRVAAALGAVELNTAYQVHSSRVTVIDRDLGEAAPEADGVVTAAPGVLCGALAADCAPILLADRGGGVVGAVHAGWRGALGGVIEAGVAALVGLGAKPGQIVAAVGPCIGPASYEVGPEFRETFVQADRANDRFFAAGALPDKSMFDLPAFVRSRLAGAGVEAEWLGKDTAADTAFFSNRRAFKAGEADYGRLASAIAIAP